MSDRFKKSDARLWFAKAYEHQMLGDLDEAIDLYQHSIDLDPTAEAHTFLGWAYSMMGRYEDAIEECKKATALDPDFGNPWNDIGAYLIELGREDEAIPYLSKALTAQRYDHYSFAHFNLSRVYLKKGMLHRALKELNLALEKKPNYREAKLAIEDIQAQIN